MEPELGPVGLTDSEAAGVAAESAPRGTVLENRQGDLWPLSLPGACATRARGRAPAAAVGTRDGAAAPGPEGRTGEPARDGSWQRAERARGAHGSAPPPPRPRAPRLLSGLSAVNAAIKTPAPRRLTARGEAADAEVGTELAPWPPPPPRGARRRQRPTLREPSRAGPSATCVLINQFKY